MNEGGRESEAQGFPHTFKRYYTHVYGPVRRDLCVYSQKHDNILM